MKEIIKNKPQLLLWPGIILIIISFVVSLLDLDTTVGLFTLMIKFNSIMLIAFVWLTITSIICDVITDKTIKKLKQELLAHNHE